MTLQLYSTLLCRTPYLSFQNDLHTHWEELKEAIHHASLDLYQEIQQISADEWDHLSPKLQYACWKYYNRARFRPTPFGLFGSITSLSIIQQQESAVMLDKDIQVRRFTGWEQKELVLQQKKPILEHAQLFIQNTALYSLGNHLRYINLNEQGIFEIATIEQQAVIEDLLKFCSLPRKKDEISDFLSSQHALVPTIVDDLLEQLIDLQLLLTDLHPNIIGEDYFNRIGFHLPNQPPSDYLICSRSLLQGGVSQQKLTVIPEALHFIKDYLPHPKSAALEEFIRAFQLKFEYKEVPLLLALDPEAGVGYQNLAAAPFTSPLITQLKQTKQQDEAVTTLRPYGVLEQFLLNRLIKQEDIQLEQLGKHAQPKEITTLSNTLSGLVQFVDDHVILETLGGSTANALLGRFSLGNEEILAHCRQLAAIEQAANPDIIFFDIAYQAENRIDNVNRRASIYDYELPILTWHGSKHLLSIQDIVVSIRNQEIVLRSLSLGKRLIPRLASAYNYTRSDLALYRFLSDLQHQKLFTNFKLDLPGMFPLLDYYPRLSYKNLILSPRQWKVPKELIKKGLDKLDLLKSWLDEQDVSEWFKAGTHDQHLWFNRHLDQDLRYFLHYCKEKEIYISEALLPRQALEQNQQQEPYLAEHIVSVVHQERVYAPVQARNLLLDTHSSAMVMPGEPWLYAEIYLHPIRSNLFLTETLLPFLKRMKPYISQWFFVRYTIPSHHLRIRLLLKDPTGFNRLIHAFNNSLKPEINAQLVNDYHIKPYQREIERYGAQDMEIIETLFCKDSHYVLQLVQRNLDECDLYLLSMHLLETLLTSTGWPLAQQWGFIQNKAKQFAEEHQVQGAGFKYINESYKELSARPFPRFTKDMGAAYEQLIQQIQHTLTQVDETNRYALIGDLFHMHVNRLFTSDQRMHELVIYQYFQKKLLREQKHSQPLT